MWELTERVGGERGEGPTTEGWRRDREGAGPGTWTGRDIGRNGKSDFSFWWDTLTFPVYEQGVLLGEMVRGISVFAGQRNSCRQTLHGLLHLICLVRLYYSYFG